MFIFSHEVIVIVWYFGRLGFTDNCLKIIIGQPIHTWQLHLPIYTPITLCHQQANQSTLGNYFLFFCFFCYPSWCKEPQATAADTVKNLW